MQILKRYMLLIAMLLGVVGYKWLSLLMPVTHYMILVMLFFTFLKVDPKRMRLTAWHGWLIIFQIGVSIGLYFALLPLNKLLAEGTMLCVFMPTATAAAVITQRLGGDLESQTTYTLLSNLLVAVLAPALFPLMEPGAHLTFWQGFGTILRRVFPVLMGPFFAAWLVRYLYERIKNQPLTLSPFWTSLPFYVWAFSLAILMAGTTHSLLNDTYELWVVLALAITSLVTCLAQFFTGKWIGHYSGQQIAAGQALGQKNTILAIWLANTYLNPLVSLAPCAYILWQNLFNGWQLAKQSKKKS